MSQSIVLQKLAYFLELTHKDASKLLCHDLRNEGHCQGFSICFAAMQQINKMDWWEAALKIIATWDGDATSLQTIIKLQDKDPPITYTEIFTRVLNYLVFFQADTDSQNYENMKINQYRWNRLLKPNNAFFEILCSDNKIRKITKNKTAAGFFTINQLHHLLDAELMTNSMCLIYNPIHVITVSYQKPYWLLYDPNYDHDVSSEKSIHKRFYNKKLLIKEILKIQGNSLSVVYASFKELTNLALPLYDQIIKKNSCNLLKQHGLHILSAHAPHNLSKILKHAAHYKQTPSLLADALFTHDEFGWTGLHVILRESPYILPLVLQSCGSSRRCGLSLTLALGMVEHNSNSSGFDMLLCFASKHLSLVLSYVEKSCKGKKILALALSHQSQPGVTGLYYVAKYAPNQLNRILNYIADCKQAAEALADALTTKMVNGQSGWDYVLNRNPSARGILLNILFKHDAIISEEHCLNLQNVIASSTVTPCKNFTRSSLSFFKTESKTSNKQDNHTANYTAQY